MYGCITLTGRCRFSSTFNEDICKKWHVLYPTADTLTKVKKKKLINASGGAICCREALPLQNVAETPLPRRIYNMTSNVAGSLSKRTSPTENMRMVCYASESSNNERQLRLLESYFAKLKNDANQTSADSSNKKTDLNHRSGNINAKNTLGCLDSYLEKLNKDPNFQDNVLSTSDDQTTEGNQVGTPFSISKSSERGVKGELKGYKKFKSRDGVNRLVRPQTLPQNDKISDLYLVGALASINIAVFLFDIASPVSNSEFELFSLPLLHGAKINDLILVGEWWRLVTPMFLHSGLCHIALGCWALLTFGPQVCKNYGSFTFLLIYTLGGFSGNLTSFLHTPEPTVGGTGPVFAIIGAWLIYQMQNKDVIEKDVSKSMFQKAMVATTLSFIISNLGPIDNWTHFGAAFTGIIYGFLTCPTLQVDDASSRTNQEERITLVRQYANSCKSLAVFTIFIIVLSSFLFFIEPPLLTLAP
ncbi:RHOMBOID-like protein 9, chloroplastic isoform X2 [Pistacia vera]|uniref:RHOMBOID-like protein 9, chloroplastic isoform X2 n=1 Tax=Pistacia vera TaxID=55513 RepID=UPI001263A069|nr:RHOMBOID-like protein 9, chloroplastic isoform X2 [Pistacia vera]